MFHQSAIVVQMRVVAALVLRETKTRYWRNRLGYVWAVLEPIGHMATWLLIFVFLRSSPISDTSLKLLLFMTGVLPFFAFRSPVRFMETAISGNRALLSYPPVKPVDFVIARWTLEVAGTSAVAVIVVVFLSAFGFVKPPVNPLGLGVAMALQFLLAFGMGCCNAVFSALSDGYAKTEDLLMRLLYFGSGVFFPMTALPSQYQEWLILNPVSHGIQLFRDAYSPQFQQSFASPLYMIAWAAVLTLIGLSGAKLARERLHFA